MSVTLLLGGARSGKSEVAEARLAAAPGPRTYVATWPADVGDADMAARVAAHRQRRPAAWGLVEVAAPADLPAALRRLAGSALVDSLGTWVAAADGFDVDIAALCEALRSRSGHTVVVSDEVGLGVHPETEVGRRFRDALGMVNRAVAAAADEALLVVAGRVIRLEEAG